MARRSGRRGLKTPSAPPPPAPPGRLPDAIRPHPAVFPVALVEAVLTAFSDPGDLIYEPFCGSGTQIVAAERAGRRCIAMELDPVYCDVAVRRWEMATGRVASRL